MARNYFYTLLLLVAGVSSIFLSELRNPGLPWLSAPDPLPDSVLNQFLDQKSSIGTTEDPQARQHWEWLMLRDPRTGRIPANIRQQELAYAQQLPIVDANLPQARTSETEWRSAGPYNVAGRTRALELDIRNENIILAGGVSGGMWRSENGGEQWTKTTNPEQLQSVTCLVQDTRPGQQNTWYYGTGELIGNSARGGDAPYRGDGIYKSTDNGLSWQVLPATSTNRPETFDNVFDYIFNLKINPANPLVQELYAAAFGGIFRSVDGGNTWTASLADSVAMYTDVTVTSEGVLYASLSTQSLELRAEETGSAGLYRSSNGGLSWQTITPPGWPDKFGRVIISYNKQNPDEVYFLGYIDDQAILWRYRHAQAGGSWEDLTDNLPENEEPVAGLDLQGGYNMLLEVHPGEPQTVFVGGTNLFRSGDGFTTAASTDWIGGYNPENNVNPYPNQHPDQHKLIFYPSNPARAIAAHDGGLSYTENILARDEEETEQVDWTFLNRGYVTTQFYTVGLDQSQVNDLIIGGMQDNGSYLTPAASSASNNWIRVLGGDGGYTHVANRGAYYYVSFQNSQIYRLTLNDNYGLASFARVDPPDAGLLTDQPYLFVNPYVFDPTSKNRMYLAAGDVIYRNRNVSQIPSGSQQPASLNWQRLIDTEVDSGSISAISISAIPTDILYYGTSTGEVYKATDANTAPVVSHISSPDFPEDGYVAHIAINPADGNELIVVYSNYRVRSIFYSNNGGDSFTDISGNLEEFPSGLGSGPSVRHVEIIPLETGQMLYMAGTSTGVYSTRALQGENTVWQQEAPELIGRVVVPQIRHRALDGRVVVATHGNGVYFKDYDGVLNTYIDPEGIPISMDAPYPNPMTPDDELVIPFNLPRNGTTRIRIYSITGQLIKLLFYNQAFAGKSEVVWNGRNVAGVPVAPGMYIVRLEFEDEILSRKVILQ